MLPKSKDLTSQIIKIKNSLKSNIINNNLDDDGLKKQSSRLEKKLKKAINVLYTSSNDQPISKEKSLMILQWLLAMILEMLPIADSKYKETESNGVAYVIMGLTKQAVEVINTLNEINNSKLTASYIMKEIIKPIFENLLQFQIQSLELTRSEILSRFNINSKELNTIFSNQLVQFSNYVKESYKQGKTDLDTFLKE